MWWKFNLNTYLKYPTIYPALSPKSANYLGHSFKKPSSHTCPFYMWKTKNKTMDLYLTFTNFHVGIHSLKLSYLMPLHFGHLVLQLCFDGKMVDITSNLERALPFDNNFFSTEQAGQKKAFLDFPIFCNTA